MINQSDKILAEELVKNNLISQGDIEKCMSEVESTEENLTTFLVENGFVSEDQILEALSSGLSLETVNLRQVDIDRNVIDRVPVKFAWYYKFMPIKIESNTLILASATPLNVKIQDEIRVHLSLEPKVVLARETDVLEALKKYYGLGAETIDKILTKEPETKPKEEAIEAPWVEDLEKESEDASVAKLVNQIFLDAYRKRATDIHIEPYREKVRLRYRIDGVLVDANLPAEARQFLRPMLSRIKIMANLSIEERRLPQDGSAVVKTKDQDLDLRISTIPTPRGESMVIRILPTEMMLYSLEKLGLNQQHRKIFRELIATPHGIVLVTGPTGSGKSTTLYACLSEINLTERKIITIEDPIECEMEGVTQIQVNTKVNLDFARGLRSVLRHDPDIIMVGEIRDLETAEIAIRTALTGHLVFSTLHTNDAASGITRLVDMGVEPFLVSSSIEAFVAQRLVRVICPKCKEVVASPLLELKEEIAWALKLKDVDTIKIYRGRGCEYCNQTGYYGRTAIYEILMVNETIRSAILEKKRADEIKRLAMQNGMTTLRQDGWQKVVEGLTTPEEVMNVTAPEESPELLAVGSGAQPPEPAKKKQKTEPPSVEVKKERPKIKTIAETTLSRDNEYDSRVYARAEIELRLRFQLLEKDENDPEKYITDGVEHSTYTRDVSAGGVRFIAGSSLIPGAIVEMKIQLHEGEKSVDCLAKICRVEEDSRSGMFNIIAFFLDISSADRVKIDNFVRSILGNKK